ncbi:MAG: hypothetical protein WB799_19560 [Candidatus Sulfotelmatobacter sp.]
MTIKQIVLVALITICAVILILGISVHWLFPNILQYWAVGTFNDAMKQADKIMRSGASSEKDAMPKQEEKISPAAAAKWPRQFTVLKFEMDNDKCDLTVTSDDKAFGHEFYGASCDTDKTESCPQHNGGQMLRGRVEGRWLYIMNSSQGEERWHIEYRTSHKSEQ